MRTSSFAVVLDAPIQQLFPYLAHPVHRPDWQSSILELELRDDGPPRVGMRWMETARGFGRFEMEISEHVTNKRWAERGQSSRGRMELALDFEQGESPDRTKLTVSVTLQLKGIFALTESVAPVVLRPLMTADLKKAAKLARASSSG